jgi:hypothetical protein
MMLLIVGIIESIVSFNNVRPFYIDQHLMNLAEID